MGEIKFRLRIGNRIVGYERIKPDEDGYLISTYSFDNSIGGWLFEPIKHKNKDEFISSKDKNGKEIYEGDIIKHDWFRNGEPFLVENLPFFFYEIIEYGVYESETEEIHYFEIVGNIYENPELLQSEK